MGGKPSAILILADFSDGSWHALKFSMTFLYTIHTRIFILQTFKSPKFGQFMTRNIVPRLEKITKDELNARKLNLLRNFEIKDEQIELLSFQGDLLKVLQNKLDVNYSYNIVFGTYSSFADSGTMQFLCLTKLINSTCNPLFILPALFDEKRSNKILFVGNPSKTRKSTLKNLLVNFCVKTHSELDILFIIKNEVESIKRETIQFYESYFKKIKHKISHTKNSSVCKGMRNYLLTHEIDLIVIEGN